MTRIYSYTKAKESFDLLFKKAVEEGEVKIRKDNQLFILTTESTQKSALDVKGIDMDISIKEIINYIHESRERK